MVPATHSSTPYHESEDGEAQRPPPDKAKNHQHDPGWLSELIEFCYDRHGGTSRLNVNNIYIAASNCQEGGSTARDDFEASTLKARSRQHFSLQEVQGRASRPALRPPAALRVTSARCAVPRRRGRTARQCHVTSTRCEERPSRQGAETAVAFAHTGSQKRHGGRQMPAPRLHAIRDWSQAEYRPRTSRSNRPARLVRIQGRPCPSDRAQRMAAGGHRPTSARAQSQSARIHAARGWREVHRGHGNGGRVPPG